MEELQTMAVRVVALRSQEEKEKREKLKRKRLSQGYITDDLDIMARRAVNPNPPGKILGEEEKQYQRERERLDGKGNRNGNGNSRRGSKDSKHANTPESKKGMVDQNYLSPQLPPNSLGNSKHEYDTISMAVGQRTPEERIPSVQQHLPSSASISAGILGYEPLKGLHLVITHVKDTLEDDVDVAENVLASLKRLEGDKRLGCTFSLSEQGGTIYF